MASRPWADLLHPLHDRGGSLATRLSTDRSRSATPGPWRRWSIYPWRSRPASAMCTI